MKKQEKIPICNAEKRKHEIHLKEKKLMRAEKQKDKTDCAKSDEKMLIEFDLENITLPKADVSGFFYKQKLTLHNLTANTSDQQGYCAIWTELTSGRAGNDITSAFIAILNKFVVDYPKVT